MMKRRMIACAVAAALLTGAVPAFPNVLVHAENCTSVKDESGVYCFCRYYDPGGHYDPCPAKLLPETVDAEQAYSVAGLQCRRSVPFHCK